MTTTGRLMLLVTALVLTSSLAAFAATEAPFSAPRIGDWIEMKSISTVNGKPCEQFVRQEIVKKDEKTLTLRFLTKLDGKDAPITERVVPLDVLSKKSDLLQQVKATGARVENLGTGQEPMKAAGKEFASTWEKYKFVKESGEDKGTTVITLWTCQEIPLFGIVKIVMDMDGPAKVTSTTELVNFGLGQ